MNDITVATALAFIMASYEEQAKVESASEVIVVRNAKVPAKEKSQKAVKNKAQAATGGNGAQHSLNRAPGPKSEPLPNPRTISHQEFLLGLKDCGKRLNANNVPVFQNADLKRHDEIRLIASYIGYNPKELHGSQLENAAREAKLALKPVTKKEYKRGAFPTFQGFIAGLPDHTQKLVQDLLAREQVAAQAIVTHQNTLETNPAGSPQHTLAMGLMAVENERIEQIRKDLAKLGAI